MYSSVTAPSFVHEYYKRSSYEKALCVVFQERVRLIRLPHSCAKKLPVSFSLRSLSDAIGYMEILHYKTAQFVKYQMRSEEDHNATVLNCGPLQIILTILASGRDKSQTCISEYEELREYDRDVQYEDTILVFSVAETHMRIRGCVKMRIWCRLNWNHIGYSAGHM
jgi:hypothetical protein